MSFPQTFTGALAAPSGDQAAAPSTPLAPARVFQVTAASQVPSARAGRTVAAGSFPVWAVFTDEKGAAVARMLVTGPGTYYLGERTGVNWHFETSQPTGADLAYDVTVSDDPRAWFLADTAAGRAAPAAGVSDVLVRTVPKLVSAAGLVDDIVRPVGARALQLVVQAAADGFSGGGIQANLAAFGPDGSGPYPINATVLSLATPFAGVMEQDVAWWGIPESNMVTTGAVNPTLGGGRPAPLFATPSPPPPKVRVSWMRGTADYGAWLVVARWVF